MYFWISLHLEVLLRLGCATMGSRPAEANTESVHSKQKYTVYKVILARGRLSYYVAGLPLDRSGYAVGLRSLS